MRGLLCPDSRPARCSWAVQAIEATLDKNPTAFRPKIARTAGGKHSKVSPQPLLLALTSDCRSRGVSPRSCGRAVVSSLCRAGVPLQEVRLLEEVLRVLSGPQSGLPTPRIWAWGRLRRSLISSAVVALSRSVAPVCASLGASRVRALCRLRASMRPDWAAAATSTLQFMVYLCVRARAVPQANIYCSDNCKCHDCKNYEGGTRPVLRRTVPRRGRASPR